MGHSHTRRKQLKVFVLVTTYTTIASNCQLFSGLKYFYEKILSDSMYCDMLVKSDETTVVSFINKMHYVTDTGQKS